MHPTHVNSTAYVTDQTGATIQKGLQGPYGEAWVSGGTFKDKRYAGMEQRESETDLDPTPARMLENRLYRWLSPDNFLNDTTALDPQSWNLYAYARNNPVRLTDPTGEKIYVGTLNSEDLAELLSRVNNTYGCEGCVTVDAEGFLQVDTSSLSQDITSATADLTGAINSTSWFGEVSVKNNDPSVAFGEGIRNRSHVTWNKINRVADLIKLDFGDDKWVSGDQAAARAFLDTVFAHEVIHFFPKFIRDPDSPGQTGPVVDSVNQMTNALGWARRMTYFSNPRGEHWFSIPYSVGGVDKHGRPKETTVYINWLKRNVGGKGIN